MAENCTKLKVDLGISPRDYRALYMRPNAKFNPAWMCASDKKNKSLSDDEAMGSTVKLCLFPALVEQDAKPFDDDTSTVEDALVKNKKFLPDYGGVRTIETTRPFCKAVVLVLRNTGGGHVDSAGSTEA